MNSQELVKKIVRILDSKKGLDIEVIEIGELSTLGDYFVLVSGGSSTQVKALAEEVEDTLAKDGIEPKRIEGAQSALWILMDYRDVIVHVFYKEARGFYQLERLWADGEQVDISQYLVKEDMHED